MTQGECKEQYNFKQECIPVGCVPPAAVAISGGFPHTPPGARPPPIRDQTTPGPGTPPGTRHRPLWTETLTHATENITLPQTSFAGDKNMKNLTVDETVLPWF